MGKIVIDAKLLLNNTQDILNKTINTLIFELGLDGEKISKEILENSNSKESYIKTINKYFENYLILRI